MLPEKFTAATVTKGKLKNKELLCEKFGLSVKKPLIAFIGRLVFEKGSDMLPEAIERSFQEHGNNVNFLILGTGETETEIALQELKTLYPKNCNVFIGYDEALAHLIYAGADFLLMPSRVEPCGLNQLYAIRYGTVPVVRSTGGLKDTVIDIADEGGYGIRFNNVSVNDISASITRAIVLYKDAKKMQLLRKRMMGLDFSWYRSAKEYIDLYESLIPKL
jgi:starch synthase